MKQYIFKTETMSEALTIIDDMQEMLDTWESKFPGYTRDISIKDLSKEEVNLPIVVTLSIKKHGRSEESNNSEA